MSVLMGFQEDRAKVSGLVHVHFMIVRRYVCSNLHTDAETKSTSSFFLKINTSLCAEELYEWWNTGPQYL